MRHSNLCMSLVVNVDTGVYCIDWSTARDRITCICRFGWRNRLVILNSNPGIFTTCHLWKCRYRVYWNLRSKLSILKVISWKVIHLKRNFTNKSWPSDERHNPPCYGNWKCSPILLLARRTFDLFFSHFYDMKS